jgi:hypothetical protein
MKIDLNAIDREQFMVHPHLIGDEVVYLVQPQHIGAKWTRDTLIYRSSVWNQQGEPVSLSFKKFFNWAEQPDLAYTPFSLTANGGVNLIEKIDGSTLIVSKYKGQLITRTRGTLDASKAEKNGHEIQLLKDKYPSAFDPKEGFSLLYEWVSPLNRIVLDYGVEPDIYLIGIIKHEDYTYVSQDNLDKVASDIQVKRPKTYNFNSIKEMLEAVEAFQGEEGVCVYCNRDQDIRKVKSASYLALHRFRENANIETVVDLYGEFGYPEYQAFEEQLTSKFDYECFNMVRGFASQVCEAKKQVDKIVEGMHRFIEPLKTKSRKDAALTIQKAYGETNRASFCFTLLDGKPLDKDKIKKLLYQCLKK